MKYERDRVRHDTYGSLCIARHHARQLTSGGYMYVCHKCAKSILPSELVHQMEGGIRMPYHSFCLEALRKRYREQLGLAA